MGAESDFAELAVEMVVGEVTGLRAKKLIGALLALRGRAMSGDGPARASL